MTESYKDLIVWQRAIDLVVATYEVTRGFPLEEKYGLSAQMRRAAVSVPSNIAEGSKRKDLPEYLQFLRTANASSAELETQMIISKKIYSRLDYSKLEGLVGEVQKMLSVLIRSLNEKSLKPNTSHLSPNAGVGLVELIVALGVFSIVVSIAVGGFARALQTQRQARALLLVNSNMSLVFEQIAREIRTGYDFCINGQSCTPGSNPTIKDELSFRNAQNVRVTYCLDQEGIERREVGGGCGGGGPSEKITSDDVAVRYLTFYLFGNQDGDGYPPRVTMVMGISPRAPGISENIMRLETTVSARTAGD